MNSPNDLWDYSTEQRSRVLKIWKSRPLRIGLLLLVGYSKVASWRDWIVPMMKTANKMKDAK